MFYSATTNVFYPDEFRPSYEATGAWPTDAVEVTDDEWHIYGQGNPPAGYRRGADANGRPTWAEIPPEPANVRRARAKADIDTAAGQARGRFVSPGDLVDQEYLSAESAAQAFKDAGYPSTNVPVEVQAWADASGLSVTASADDILATAANWRATLAHIRSLRLKGKSDVDAALDADIETVAAAVVADLDAVTPV